MGQKLALCIGINHYPPGHDSDLSGCLNDALDWSVELKARGYTVSLLLDSQATRKAILGSVAQAVRALSDGDKLIITNSSHGTQIPDDNGDEADQLDEATCCYDTYQGGLVRDDEWWGLFRSKRPGVAIAFISDSCHSGTVARRIDPVVHTADPDAKRRFIPFSALPRDILKHSMEPRDSETPRLFEDGWGARNGTERVPWPVLLMSGCQDDEYSYDASINGRYRGAFTAAALTALRTMPYAANFNDWFLAIRRQLPNRQYPQTPRLIGSYLKYPALFV